MSENEKLPRQITFQGAKRKVLLRDLKSGSLFQYEGELHLKVMIGFMERSECYHVGTGEFFDEGYEDDLYVLPVKRIEDEKAK